MRKLIFLLFLLPACSKIPIERERTHILTQATKQFSCITDTEDVDIQALLSKSISRDDAVRIALINNPALQAEFESIGIAKADLMQAGLYTNPELGVFTKFPIRAPVTQIDVSLAFSLNDLWQIPFKQKVFKDQLNATSLKVLVAVHNLIIRVELAYTALLYTQAVLKRAQALVNIGNELKRELETRSKLGLIAAKDISTVTILQGRREIELIKLKGLVLQSHVELARVLGLLPTIHFELKETFKLQNKEAPPAELLEQWALTYRPVIQLAQANVKTYQDLVASEKRQRVKSVGIGTTFERDFVNETGMGPDVRIQLPVFDQNQAQIGKAEFLLQKAQKELEARRDKVRREVYLAYNALKNLQEQHTIYKTKILPEHAKVPSVKGAKTLQAPAYLEAQAARYEAKKSLLALEYDIAKAWIELERVIGRKLECRG